MKKEIRVSGRWIKFQRRCAPYGLKCKYTNEERNTLNRGNGYRTGASKGREKLVERNTSNIVKFSYFERMQKKIRIGFITKLKFGTFLSSLFAIAVKNFKCNV